MEKKEWMTSRERVLAALNHQQPDRMPIDLGMHFSTGISAFAYWNLREYLGLSTNQIEIPDLVQFLARVDTDILEMVHGDCILLKPTPARPQRFKPRGPYDFIVPHTFQPVLNKAGEWHAAGIDGKKMRMPEGGYFFDGEWPDFRDRSKEEDLKSYGDMAQKLYEETDYFTMYQGLNAFFDQSVEMMIRMYEDPEGLIEDNKRLLEEQLKYAEQLIGAFGNHVQGICLGADLGTQNGPMMNPAMYEEFFAPYMKELIYYIHKNSDYKIFYHCCGSIKPFLPILIDCGIDIINPVQHSAENMDPMELKAEFGNQLTFWGGGVNCQHILNRGTEEEIRQNVRELCNIFKPNGGFVFNPIHNLMGDIPPEKIMMVYEEAYKNSFYKS